MPVAVEAEGELWKTSDLSDVGPAGPAAAYEGGVVMTTKDNRVKLSRLSTRGAVAFTPIEEPPSSFAPYGRGPAVLGKVAYWVTGSKLLRAPLRNGAAATALSGDARYGTRVSAARLSGAGRKHDAVAYISHPKGGTELKARLWVDARGSLELTPEGGSASSVTLLEQGSGVLAVVLEGRTSMSPVHARSIKIDKDKLEVGPDDVLWVGPPSQPLTELTTLGWPGAEAWAFVALERDVTHFGLALLKLAKTDAALEATWHAYANGIDPAPVAAARICGRTALLYAAPSDARPRAPQELRLAYLADGALGASQVVATSRAFSDVSLAAGSARTAILAWVADHRTWALRAECRSPGPR